MHPERVSIVPFRDFSATCTRRTCPGSTGCTSGLPTRGYFGVTLCDNYEQKPCNLNLQRKERLYTTVSDQNLEQLHPVLKIKTPVGGESNIRLKIKDFFADILCDRRSCPEIWHWVVQRKGSPEILNWGHESSQERAEQEARAYLQSLVNLKQLKEQQAI